MKILCLSFNEPLGHENYESYFNEKIININDDFDLDLFIENEVKNILNHYLTNYENALIEIWEEGKLIKAIMIKYDFKTKKICIKPHSVER